MTIHLLRTPDYEANDFFAVLSLLQSTNPSTLTFRAVEQVVDSEEFPFLSRHYKSLKYAYQPLEQRLYALDRNAPLSWREMFDVCHWYRRWADVPADDPVMLLTPRPNALNWFSGTDEHHNSFIHTGDWEHYITSHHKYPVAYQVWATVLRDAMQLPAIGEHTYFHERPIGCMNDFCEQKIEVALKLRTADICDRCCARFEAVAVNPRLIFDGLEAFSSLREQMLLQQGFRRKASVSDLVVTDDLNITFTQFGKLDVAMPHLSKLMYLFFLRHPEGVRMKELGDHRAELMYLYRQVSSATNWHTLNDRIDRVVAPLAGSTRDQSINRANKAMRDALGESIAEPYLISGTAGELYRIGLPASRITLPRFLTEMPVPPANLFHP
ncbi:hypothetical protein GCM10027578_26000 [Spirosoma luteolum]